MKARPDEIGHFDRLFEGGASTFLYRGTNGRWRDVLTPDEVARSAAAEERCVPADARAWLTGTPAERVAHPPRSEPDSDS
jgi:hypothetical protein